MKIIMNIKFLCIIHKLFRNKIKQSKYIIIINLNRRGKNYLQFLDSSDFKPPRNLSEKEAEATKVQGFDIEKFRKNFYEACLKYSTKTSDDSTGKPPENGSE